MVTIYLPGNQLKKRHVVLNLFQHLSPAEAEEGHHVFTPSIYAGAFTPCIYANPPPLMQSPPALWPDREGATSAARPATPGSSFCPRALSACLCTVKF
jgi:hypothetical protein